ncbi:MAG: hypothetical protein M0Z75_11030 [Nitrospiraceae bacterium]|nr:hypothetical protein [Nitrospiraceae bacterium]
MPRDDPSAVTAVGWRAWCAQRPDGTLDRQIGPRPFPAAVWKGIAAARFGADAKDRDAVTAARDQAKRVGWRVVPVEIDLRATRYAGRFDADALEAWRMGSA